MVMNRAVQLRKKMRKNSSNFTMMSLMIFYKLFLDERMIYTCAYFTDWNNSLDQAQYEKLDMICKKLRLKEGETMLDIGCGWGGLLIHAA